MGLVRKEGDGRLHLQSQLMGESLMDKALIASTDTDTLLRVMPDVQVVKIGGQSVTDRGRVALFPILDEIIANRPDKKIVISTGGGQPVQTRLLDCIRPGHACRCSGETGSRDQRAERLDDCDAVGQPGRHHD